MNVYFYTLGCKVNQYETEGLKEDFKKKGFTVSDTPTGCQVLVINSCTVTSVSDRKTRQMLHRFRSENPDALVALTGCFPQAFPEEAAALPEVDIISGTKHKEQLAELCLRYFEDPHKMLEVEQYAAGDLFEAASVTSAGGRTRAFLKIQDGCDNWCSYCIIPKARGPVRSKPMDDLLSEAAKLSEAGFKELVFVGINLCFYGREWGLSLVDAVEAVAHRHPGLRIRLGSIEPELMTGDELNRLAALPGFCPQFHLSLQSGCDATLARMRRHYDTALFRALVRGIRARFENPAITTDILVGFPGETEAEFATTVRFAEEIGFSKIHIFPYSVRPGTIAAQLPDQVPAGTKTARVAALREAAEPCRERFLSSMVGNRCQVLIETKMKDGLLTGYTENYLPVLLKGPEALSGTVVPVLVTGVQNGALLSRSVEEQGETHR